MVGHPALCPGRSLAPSGTQRQTFDDGAIPPGKALRGRQAAHLPLRQPLMGEHQPRREDDRSQPRRASRREVSDRGLIRDRIADTLDTVTQCTRLRRGGVTRGRTGRVGLRLAFVQRLGRPRLAALNLAHTVRDSKSVSVSFARCAEWSAGGRGTSRSTFTWHAVRKAGCA